MSDETKRVPHDPKQSEQEKSREEIKEENFDKTLADSFPASDPPSTLPDPDEEEDDAA